MYMKVMNFNPCVAGEETLKRFIAKRKEALRLCDEEARKRYAASAKEMRHQAQSEAEPLGRRPISWQL